MAELEQRTIDSRLVHTKITCLVKPGLKNNDSNKLEIKGGFKLLLNLRLTWLACKSKFDKDSMSHQSGLQEL